MNRPHHYQVVVSIMTPDDLPQEKVVGLVSKMLECGQQDAHGTVKDADNFDHETVAEAVIASNLDMRVM